MKKTLYTLLCLILTANLHAMGSRINWDKAIDTAVAKYGLRTEPELRQEFAAAHVAYPPRQVAILAFKKERKIELWASDTDQSWRYIKQYPLTAFSGRLGPKLRERDGQIPEGIYRLTSFNPFSTMHLSIMIDYPNAFDKNHAMRDHRRRLGDNIFIHGKNLSVGCLAVGNWAIDQLFLLTRKVGLDQVELIIAPNDLRHTRPATPREGQPQWLPDLYHQIKQVLTVFHKQPWR